MKEILLLLVMFWNVENYFDTYDNPATNDEEFTPVGENHWSRKKFEQKRDDIAKTIMLAADQYGEFPALLGLCEVENRYVLEELVENTPLARVGYKIIHRDSPDSRGIDAALLYREETFAPLETKYLKADFPTREILYTKGVINKLDTVHILVNHWPSKSGGEKQSLLKRYQVAKVARHLTDSILQCNSRANILLMGDFNDTPDSLPLEYLVAPEVDSAGNVATGARLVNLAPFAAGADGTYKYREEWNTIDQFIVSENLLPDDSSLMPQWIFCHREMEIFAPEFLLQRDNTYMGLKMRRTYQGPRYMGGVSDHLPILLKIYTEDSEYTPN